MLELVCNINSEVTLYDIQKNHCIFNRNHLDVQLLSVCIDRADGRKCCSTGRKQNG